MSSHDCNKQDEIDVVGWWGRWVHVSAKAQPLALLDCSIGWWPSVWVPCRCPSRIRARSCSGHSRVSSDRLSLRPTVQENIIIIIFLSVDNFTQVYSDLWSFILCYEFITDDLNRSSSPPSSPAREHSTVDLCLIKGNVLQLFIMLYRVFSYCWCKVGVCFEVIKSACLLTDLQVGLYEANEAEAGGSRRSDWE